MVDPRHSVVACIFQRLIIFRCAIKLTRANVAAVLTTAWQLKGMSDGLPVYNKWITGMTYDHPAAEVDQTCIGLSRQPRCFKDVFKDAAQILPDAGSFEVLSRARDKWSNIASVIFHVSIATSISNAT